MFCSAVVHPTALSMRDKTGTLHTLIPKAVEETHDTFTHQAAYLFHLIENAEYCGWYYCLSLV